MDQSLLRELSAAVAPGRVSTAPADLAAYSRDMWPMAMLWLERGQVARFPPAAVVWPRDEAGIVRLLALAERHGLPIIPYGGGSGVAGGTVPTHGGVVVDLKALDRILDVDPHGLTCRVQAGVVGEHLERALEARGLTLGHFPSSMYCSTVGGWLATRSAGQMSSLYGKIEDMVLQARVVLPSAGGVTLGRAGSGFGWLQAMVGSEGTLGLFTEATFRVHRAAARREFSAWSFPDVAAGIEGMRRVMQAGLSPAVLRLYDPFDTMLAGGRSGPKPRRWAIPELVTNAARAVVNEALGVGTRAMNFIAGLVPGPALLVMVFEGEPEVVSEDLSEAEAICRSCGAKDLGPGPARGWYRDRYGISYKQSWVYEVGAFVDTMEVASSWRALPILYREVPRAIYRYAFVMAHFSHAYLDGCSIYFTFVGPARVSDAQERYLALWHDALDAAVRAGATISHHHGVGELKAGFMLREVGEGGRLVYRALAAAADPVGILNPGKLWPAEPDGGVRW